MVPIISNESNSIVKNNYSFNFNPLNLKVLKYNNGTDKF